MSPDFAGAVILGIPLYIAAWVLLRGQPRAILLFAVALVTVGLGYLTAVGATGDIARRVMPAQFAISKA